MLFLVPSFIDIIDIAIISILLFAFLLIMRKSMGVGILIGILILFILYFLASFYELRMIAGILEGLRFYWILVIIILFQNEIRSLFTHIAKSNNIVSLFSNPLKITQTTIFDSISYFSETKTGALLVFEKTQRLDNYISTGEVLDARMSSSLLQSIFNTKSLLHDGAVVIRNDRIYAAKVVLPLSNNDEFGRSYGTRHLAAIGITEVTDAFCIIVSEQTGKISFTKDKTIHRNISKEELLQVITDEKKQ